MIAEETKYGGKLPLKKRVKRLGEHQVLIGNEESSIDNEIYKRLQKKEKRMIEAIDHGSLLYRYESSVGDYEDIIQHLRKVDRTKSHT